MSYISALIGTIIICAFAGCTNVETTDNVNIENVTVIISLEGEPPIGLYH